MFTGTGTALVTPFHRDGSLDEATLRSLVKRQIAAGIDATREAAILPVRVVVSESGDGDVVDTCRRIHREVVIAHARRTLPDGAAAVGPGRRCGKLLRRIARCRARNRVRRYRVSGGAVAGHAVRRAALNLP